MAFIRILEARSFSSNASFSVKIDKALAKEKRKDKKEKRKERERAELEDEGGAELDGNEDAMANFMADAEGLDDSESEEEQQPKKKAKKWFQAEGKRKDLGGEREIETLDDLEAEAARYLG